MTLREIAASWLKEHGYAGLYRGECGCEIIDLMPCSEPSDQCAAGYEVLCDCEDGEEHDFHIQEEKP